MYSVKNLLFIQHEVLSLKFKYHLCFIWMVKLDVERLAEGEGVGAGDDDGLRRSGLEGDGLQDD